MRQYLGRKAHDLITGLEGVVEGATEWLYGCNRLVLQPTALQDGKPLDSVWFDEQRIAIDSTDRVVPLPADRGFQSIPLGSEVKDRLTGFKGIAIARSTWLSGQVSITIEPTKLREGKTLPSLNVDIQRIELVKVKEPPVSATSTARSGGPQRDPQRPC